MADESRILRADIREDGKHIKKCRRIFGEAGWEVDVGEYEVGDYFVDDVLGIEHKSPPDFVGSIKSGRLFQQAVELRQNFKRPAIFVSGNLHQVVVAGGQFKPESIYGAVTSLFVRYEVPVLFMDEIQFVPMMLRFARKATDGKGVDYSPIRQKPTGEQERTHFLAGVKGISKKRAKALLEHFGTVADTIEHVDDWGEVHGIGKKTIEHAKEIFYSSVD